MPYIRLRTKKQKLIRSWRLYAVIVGITFLVALSVSKCYADTHDTTCKIYREIVRFDTDKGGYRANLLLGTLEIRTYRFSQEEIDLIAHSESIRKENELRKKGWFLFHKCTTVRVNDLSELKDFGIGWSKGKGY